MVAQLVQSSELPLGDHRSVACRRNRQFGMAIWIGPVMSIGPTIHHNYMNNGIVVWYLISPIVDGRKRIHWLAGGFLVQTTPNLE